MSSFSQINTNIQSLQAFSSLKNTSSELSDRRLRLSTGLRINKAEDDSAGFAIAKKLQSKTRGQSQALKNITDAKSMLTVAEGGLNSTLDILQTMKEKAVQAANDSLGESERLSIQNQLEELTKEVSDIVDSTNFNGNQLLDGTGGQNGDGLLNFQVGAESSETFEVQLDSARTTDIGIANGSLNAAVFEGDFSLSTEPSLTVEAGYAGNGGEFELAFSSYNDADSSGSVTAGDEVDVTVNGDNSNVKTVTLGGSGNAAAVALNDPNNAAGNTDDIQLDFSSFTDTNVQEVVDGIAEGGAMTVKVGETSLDVSDSAAAGNAIDTIDSALNEVTDLLAGIGDSQKRLSFKSENLETARTNLESARSGIEDADFAREQTQIARLQILQQTGVASLAQANASSQSVLSLIG